MTYNNTVFKDVVCAFAILCQHSFERRSHPRDMTGLGEGHADSQEGAAKMLLAATRCWFPVSNLTFWAFVLICENPPQSTSCWQWSSWISILRAQKADSSQQSCKASADSELLESAEDLLQARYRRFVNLVGAKRCQKDGWKWYYRLYYRLYLYIYIHIKMMIWLWWSLLLWCLFCLSKLVMVR